MAEAQMTANPPVRAEQFEPGKDWERIPLHSYDLIRYLAENFPQKSKLPGEDLEEHLFYSGQATLAKVLYDWMMEEISGREDDDDADREVGDIRSVEPRRVSSRPDVS